MGLGLYLGLYWVSIFFFGFLPTNAQLNVCYCKLNSNVSKKREK